LINNFYDDYTCKAVYRFETDRVGVDSQHSNHLTNHGVINNTADFQEGYSSAQFDGNQYFSILDSDLRESYPLKWIPNVVDRFWTLPVISVSFWIKLSSVIGIQTIISKHNEDSNMRGFHVYLDSGMLKVLWGYNEGLNQKIISSNFTLSIDKWYHIGVACESTELICQIYIFDWSAQGVVCNILNETPVDRLSTSITSLTIGANYVGEYRLTGLLDEVTIFNTFKKPNEFDRIRQGVYVGFSGNSFIDDPDCIAWYDFEPQQLLDDWLNGNHLTEVNTLSKGQTFFKVYKQSAFFDLINKEYAYRLDSDLSTGFPFKSGDANKRATFVFWIRLDQSNSGGVICKSADSNGKRSFAIKMSSSTLQILWGYNGGNSTYTYSTHGLVLHRWYHIAVVVDGIRKFFTVRVWDDVLESVVYFNIFFPNDVLHVGAGPFSLGLYTPLTSYFSGWLDELLIFNNTKSLIETDLMRQGLYHRRLLFACDESNGIMPIYNLEDGLKTYSIGVQTAIQKQPWLRTFSQGVMVMFKASNRFTCNNFLADPDCAASFSFESGSQFLRDSVGGNDLTDHGTVEPVQ
jgi:hypothetical protein